MQMGSISFFIEIKFPDKKRCVHYGNTAFVLCFRNGEWVSGQW
jgi:hypothetical protein